jgi:hypothetical protein
MALSRGKHSVDNLAIFAATGRGLSGHSRAYAHR